MPRMHQTLHAVCVGRKSASSKTREGDSQMAQERKGESSLVTVERRKLPRQKAQRAGLAGQEGVEWE